MGRRAGFKQKQSNSDKIRLMVESCLWPEVDRASDRSTCCCCCQCCRSSHWWIEPKLFGRQWIRVGAAGRARESVAHNNYFENTSLQFISPESCSCMELPVWPDGGMKVVQIYLKSCPKSSLSSFTLKPKVSKFLGNFCMKVCWRELSKSPNLVTLHGTQNVSYTEIERERVYLPVSIEYAFLDLCVSVFGVRRLSVMHCAQEWEKRAVWPDLAKFRHFGQTLNIFGYSLRVYFVLGKILTLIGQNFYYIGRNFHCS